MRAIEREDHDERFVRFLEARGIFDHPDLKGHIPRYLHSLRHMPQGRYLRDGDYSLALELGTTFVFPQLLMDHMGFNRVDVTDFSSGREKSMTLPLPRDPSRRNIRSFSVDLEKDSIPADDTTYDLVLCFEVIEHMEIDPMFLMSEINRVLRPDGLCFISTPNSISARNVYKILHGYAPHFFMKYSKKRTYHRHNLEYAPHQMLDLIKSSGFQVRKFWTHDTFEDSLPQTIEFLKKNGLSTKWRGDNMFVIGQKVGPVVERYPASLYF
jgi:SAM-dependent methyltransferase